MGNSINNNHLVQRVEEVLSEILSDKYEYDISIKFRVPGQGGDTTSQK